MPITVKPIAAHETIDLRHRVMWPDRPRTDGILSEDPQGLHFGAFSGQTLVGVGSFFITDQTARLRKLAVDETHQGQGIASALLRAALPHLTAKGVKTLWCDARVTATVFYRRNGFTLETKVFQKQGRDYVIARKNLR